MRCGEELNEGELWYNREHKRRFIKCYPCIEKKWESKKKYYQEWKKNNPGAIPGKPRKFKNYQVSKTGEPIVFGVKYEDEEGYETVDQTIRF